MQVNYKSRKNILCIEQPEAYFNTSAWFLISFFLILGFAETNNTAHQIEMVAELHNEMERM